MRLYALEVDERGLARGGGGCWWGILDNQGTGCDAAGMMEVV